MIQMFSRNSIYLVPIMDSKTTKLNALIIALYSLYYQSFHNRLFVYINNKSQKLS